jgi:hypothetical protein
MVRNNHPHHFYGTYDEPKPMAEGCKPAAERLRREKLVSQRASSRSTFFRLLPTSLSRGRSCLRPRAVCLRFLAVQREPRFGGKGAASFLVRSRTDKFPAICDSKKDITGLCLIGSRCLRAVVLPPKRSTAMRQPTSFVHTIPACIRCDTPMLLYSVESVNAGDRRRRS